MRLHVNERPIARYVLGVTVDGVVVPNCIEADEEKGWARFLFGMPDEDGVSSTVMDSDGNVITYVLHGKVRLLIDFADQ